VNPAERWQSTWSSLDLEPPPMLLAELVAAYSEPHRAYHTLQHLSECFTLLDAYPGSPDDPASLDLALWFHDAIYDTKRNDNESRSAEWARRSLAGLSAARLDGLDQLILVTRHAADPTTPDQQLLLDVDLSILGAPTARFEAYESQVRFEYSWVPETAYCDARGKILRGFLARPVLFHTAHFSRLFEAQARKNLRRSLDRLGAR
jgi:predicted metal-dependent HD superfamily phosphohydrolase